MELISTGPGIYLFASFLQPGLYLRELLTFYPEDLSREPPDG
jgi:hypothetical protein